MRLDALLSPPRLHSRAEVLTRPSPVPRAVGIYGWYFDLAPGSVPTAGAHVWRDQLLLYVGIAPRRPPLDATTPSRRTLAKRIREHYALNAEGSTLRLTLGCLIGLELRRIESRKRPGTAKRMTFGRDGEQHLNEWMAEHARVVWHPCDAAWEIERALFRALTLPLNLDANAHSPFHIELTALRAAAKARARALPPLTR